jgi:hypothetical protein
MQIEKKKRLRMMGMMNIKEKEKKKRCVEDLISGHIITVRTISSVVAWNRSSSIRSG